MKNVIYFLTFISLMSLNLSANTSSDIKLDGFVDFYYAYDFKRPKNLERQFTTQPARHNEMNINLAYLGANYLKGRNRARLAIQHGTSVVKNYSGEPTKGATSGSLDSRMIQEGYVGMMVSNDTWVDAGIYLGHIGMESWISKYNWNYSRSLMLDYVPYYQTGVRVNHRHNDQLDFQFHFMNGWQNISETNQDKAIGLQGNYKISTTDTFTYNNFIGNERAAKSDISTMRTYQNLIYQKKITSDFEMKGAFDFGTQKKGNTSGTNTWFVTAIVPRYQFRQSHFIAGRLEYYHDKNQANVLTNTPNGFKTTGASVNLDKHIDNEGLIRLEYRTFFSKDSIYPKKNGTSKSDQFIVMSMSLGF